MIIKTCANCGLAEWAYNEDKTIPCDPQHDKHGEFVPCCTLCAMEATDTDPLWEAVIVVKGESRGFTHLVHRSCATHERISWADLTITLNEASISLSSPSDRVARTGL